MYRRIAKNENSPRDRFGPFGGSGGREFAKPAGVEIRQSFVLRARFCEHGNLPPRDRDAATQHRSTSLYF
jgi:hypothetical protein